MNQTIVQAIREKRLLVINYDGYNRTIEPHTYGILSTGHEALAAYQVAGGSVHGHEPPWKLFHTDKIQMLRIVGDHFANPRNGYNPNDSRFREIWAGV